MPVDQETVDAVRQLLAEKVATLTGGQATSAGAGFGQLGGAQSAPQNPFSPSGISLRCKIVLPNGSEISPYLHFGPEHCQTPDAIFNLIQNLINLGVPIDTYTPRNQGDNWGSSIRGGGGGYGGGGYGGGGYNRNGGYGRGGGGR